MFLNSFNFLLTFPCVFVLYWILASKGNITVRNVYLLAISLCFYVMFNPFFLVVLGYVTAITYAGGLFLGNMSRRRTPGWLSLFIVLALFPLLTFKYYNFFVSNLEALVPIKFPRYSYFVPMGISFFTFQAVGYVVDVYKNAVPAEHSLLQYSLFVCYFPQIVSGPISKASELLPQLQGTRAFSYLRTRSGLRLFLWGAFLKTVLADRLCMIVDIAFNDQQFMHISSLNCLLASIAYSLQIYCDFAGYTYMAIGASKLLGFDLPDNFRQPYFADSITDFWRRWHISLSRWLRDYIYIPLGGNRCSMLRSHWNILVTFLASGLWHGANWTFVVWGGYYGIAQILEKQFGWHKAKSHGFWRKIARMAIVFSLVNLAWIFFRMDTLVNAFRFIGRIVLCRGRFDFNLTGGKENTTVLVLALTILLFKDLKNEYHLQCLHWLDRPFVRWTAYLVLTMMILTLGKLDSSLFIYANF